MKKEDKVLEEMTAETDEMDDALTQIAAGKCVTEVDGIGLLTFVEPKEEQKFEGQILYNSTLKSLKENKQIDLYDQTLLPAVVKSKCKEQGIKYSVVNQRPSLVSKVIQYMNDQYGPESMDGQNVNIKLYLKARETALNEEELDAMADIDLIDTISSELKSQTYQHFAERTRQFFLLSQCVLLENQPLFRLVQKETTMFGKTWVVEAFDESKPLAPSAIETIVISFKAFLEGMAPDFLSALSAIRSVGQRSGQLQKLLDKEPSKDSQSSGQEPKEG